MIPAIAYKYIGLALVLVALCGFCYHKGYQGEHDKFLVFQAKVTQEAADQNAATKLKDEEHAKVTLAVAEAYTVDNNRLRAALEQLHKSTNRFGKLPANAQSTKSTDATVGQPSGTRGCDAEFYDSALEDALKLQSWQDWAKEQGLEVEP